jgi:quinol monooxygenase YgiN
MFARSVSIRLQPNKLTEFTYKLENHVLPILRKQSGFRDEISLAYAGDTEVTAISLWDSQEQAETYNTTAAYPQVLKSLENILDGTPTVRVSTVVHSTSHKIAAMAA